MNALGFAFQKGRFRIALLEQAHQQPSYQSHRSVKVDPDLPLPELTERYLLDFGALLQEFQPDVVASRQVFSSDTIASAVYQIIPVGLLANLCWKEKVSFCCYTPAALRQPGAYGLPKGTKPVEGVDNIFGQHPPYWDNIQREALLAAWRCLK